MDNNTQLYYQCAEQLNSVVCTLLGAYPSHVARTLLVTAMDYIEIYSQQLQIESLMQEIQSLKESQKEPEPVGPVSDSDPQDVEPEEDVTGDE